MSYQYLPPSKNYWCSPALHDYLFAPFKAAGKDHGSTWQLFAHIWQQMQNKEYRDDQSKYLPLPFRSGRDKGFIQQYFSGAEVHWLISEGLVIVQGANHKKHKCRRYRVAQHLFDGAIQYMSTRDHRINLYTGNTCGPKKRYNQIRDRQNHYLVGQLERDAVSVLSGATIQLNVTSGSAVAAQMATTPKAKQATATLHSVLTPASDNAGVYVDYSPRYKASSTGRIYEVGGGLQTASSSMRRALMGDLLYENGGTCHNYDIESAHQNAWCYYLNRYSCQAEVAELSRYMETPKAEHARKLGVTKETYKRMLYSLGYNGGDHRTAPITYARKIKVRKAMEARIRTRNITNPYFKKEQQQQRRESAYARTCTPGNTTGIRNTSTAQSIRRSSARGKGNYLSILRRFRSALHGMQKVRSPWCISVSGVAMGYYLHQIKVCARDLQAWGINKSVSRQYVGKIVRHFAPIRRAVDKIYQHAITDPAIALHVMRGQRQATFISNACGRVLHLGSVRLFKRKSKVLAHLCQGMEAAFIHNLTVIGAKHGYQPLANVHDGLITDGVIPAEAIAEVNAKLGTSFTVVEKPL